MKNIDYLVELTDGAILDVLYEEECYPGCPTCDMGSKYINEWWIKTTNHVIHVKSEQEYGYGISEAWIMYLFLRNLDEIKKITELELFDFIKNKAKEYVDNIKEESKWSIAPIISIELDDNSIIPQRQNCMF